ncbi:hypothetical protein ACOMHN_056725 [Nucella lapillus]
MASLVRSERGGKVLVYEEFKYTYHKTNALNEFVWRCWRRGQCNAKLVTRPFQRDAINPDIQVMGNVGAHHDRPPDTDLIGFGRMKSHLVQEASEDPTCPARRIYHAAAELQRGLLQSGGDVQVLPPLESVRSTIERARRQHVPTIPRTVADVEIEGVWGQTWNQDRFLLEIDNHAGFVIFVTDESLESIGRCTGLFMDGTFRACPRPFSQVFTILGNLHGFVIPFVDVLMADRRAGTYRRIFQVLKRTVRHLTHHHWRPRIIVCDFEIALWGAVQMEFPTAALSGCYFHWTKSLWRKVQDLGLAGQYRQNRRLRKLVRKAMALGFLPLALVRISFQQLLHSQNTQRLIQTYPELQEFLVTYLQNHYILANAQFLPADWNVFNRDMDQRTNNSVESYHHSLNQLVGVHHSNLWHFIRKLKDCQAESETKLTVTEQGDAPRQRRRKWRILAARICRLKQQYTNGAKNLDSYWRAISHVIWRTLA